MIIYEAVTCKVSGTSGHRPSLTRWGRRRWRSWGSWRSQRRRRRPGCARNREGSYEGSGLAAGKAMCTMRLLQTTLTFWCHCCFCLFVLYMVELAFLAVSEKFCRLDTLYYPYLCQLLAKIMEKRNLYFEAFSFPGLKYDRLDIWRRK